MIVTRTPVRVSFLGGGTDYPEHFLKHGGQTLGASVNQFSWLIVKRMAPLFDYSIRVGYSRSELVRDLDEIQHPSVRECLRFMGLDGPLEIHYIGDLPARTGLGSSSSFTVGLLHALHALKGENPGRLQLAEEAVHVERELIRENVGVQDQYTCALGGLLHLQMGQDGSVHPGAVTVDPNRLKSLQSHLLLFHTGLVRHAHEVLTEQIDRTRQGAVLDELNHLSKLAADGLACLQSPHPLAEFGDLLHQAWTTKKRLSSRITSSLIDDLYARARTAGALGGKLLGAGGGGFFLLLAPPERQDEIIRTLAPLAVVPFAFESEGSVQVFQA